MSFLLFSKVKQIWYGDRKNEIKTQSTGLTCWFPFTCTRFKTILHYSQFIELKPPEGLSDQNMVSMLKSQTPKMSGVLSDFFVGTLSLIPYTQFTDIFHFRLNSTARVRHTEEL